MLHKMTPLCLLYTPQVLTTILPFCYTILYHTCTFCAGVPLVLMSPPPKLIFSQLSSNWPWLLQVHKSTYPFVNVPRLFGHNWLISFDTSALLWSHTCWFVVCSKSWIPNVKLTYVHVQLYVFLFHKFKLFRMYPHCWINKNEIMGRSFWAVWNRWRAGWAHLPPMVKEDFEF